MTVKVYPQAAVLTCVLLVLVLSSIIAINPASLISLSIGLFLYSILHVLIMGGVQALFRGQLIFLFYALLAIVLYSFQLWTNPEYFGFSGGVGVGTDDSFFFSLAVDELPSNFPVRSDYAFRSQPYGEFLSIFSGITSYIVGSVHPLDLILVNIVGLSMIPTLAERLAFLGTADARIGRIAMRLVLICPFLLANGLVLIRDAWMSMLFLSGLLSIMSRRYLIFFASLVGSMYFRLENAFLLGFSAWMLLVFLSGATDVQARRGWFLSWSGLIKILVPPILMGIGTVVLMTSSVGYEMLEVSLYRTGFIEYMMRATNGADSFSTSRYIDQLGWLSRLMIGSLFYFGSPFLALDEWVSNGMVVPRTIMFGMFAFLFVFYGGAFARGIARIFEERYLVVMALAAIFVIDIMILSQMSLQIRHKTILMPIFYIIVAYGLVWDKRAGYSAAILTSSLIVLANLVSNSIKFL